MSKTIAAVVAALFTEMLAVVGVLFVPPLPEEIELIVFVYAATDAAAPVTVIGITQLALAARLPPVKVITLPLIATVPLQTDDEELGALMPGGSESVKLKPVSAPGLPAGLAIVMFSVEV